MARSALIIAAEKYTDPKLRKLRAPSHDAAALARVLRDPAIGDFEVEALLNEPEYKVRRKIETFFANRSRDDLLVVHFSCHGVKDDAGALYFAMPDTEVTTLDSTAVSSEFVNRQMAKSRSRRIALFLDCCYSGAFSRGARARAGEGIDLAERFEGRGQVVITASNAMEYAFEGDDLVGEGQPSVFTTALVKGLETGAADLDGDRRVSVDELYDYVFDQVREAKQEQTPLKWIYELQGELYIARNPNPVIEPAELPADLTNAIESRFRDVREGAVRELAAILSGRNRALALAAQLALESLTNDDSRAVAQAAAEALATAGGVEDEAAKQAREQAGRAAAERLAREEADRRAHEEAERLAREEAERRAHEEAERRAREEAERERRHRRWRYVALAAGVLGIAGTAAAIAAILVGGGGSSKPRRPTKLIPQAAVTGLGCEGRNCSQPSLAPDGTTIAFIRSNRGPVYVAQLKGHEGSNPSPVDGAKYGIRPSVAKTGRIAFQDQGSGSIWYTDPTQQNAVRLADGYDPSWSPDGSHMAFISNRNGSYGLLKVAVPREGHAVPLVPYAPGRKLSVPAWSPDGKQIAFIRAAGECPALGDVWVVNADGTHAHPLLVLASDERHPTWSPDGRKIAFSSDVAERADYDLYTADADGSDLVRRTSGAGDDVGPTWGQDGIAYARGAFSCSGGTNQQLWFGTLHE